ncbi:transporter [Actinomadura sp. NBRC 104412]|uniref:ABC transporter permease subunit n=1 Tax=Actinomadura sp. NBRC 104412 TaxID=3032203 RepID=UPI0024A45AAD|nr:ABC transporter permease subunit [Actinomadura sp. NBRC 104412]GLZ08837.1 transporter [Actinomadura sp. NBRC 104412]
MIWLTWRQFRVQAFAGGGALALLAIVLGLTGPDMADAYESGLATCGDAESCQRFAESFFADHQPAFLGLLAIVLLTPALVGLFWGAPLIAREVEAGTHRLVWNQSVTRTRWLAVKLAVTGLVAMLLTGLATFAVGWWAEPLDEAAGLEAARMTPLMFDGRGIAPMGYAAFAFTLGVAVGLLVRRTLAAMAVTLAVFAVVQVAMPLVVRERLLPPTSVTMEITSTNLGGFMSRGPGTPIKLTVKPGDPGAWMLTNETLDKSGKVVDTVPLKMGEGPCAENREPGARGPAAACLAEINRLGYRQKLVYHGSDRFWPLQWAETGLYVVLSLGLAGFCFYRIRRNLS